MWDFLLLVNLPKGWGRGWFLARNFLRVCWLNWHCLKYHNCLLTGSLFPFWPIIYPPHCCQNNNLRKKQNFIILPWCLKTFLDFPIIHRMEFKFFSLLYQIFHGLILVYFSSLWIFFDSSYLWKTFSSVILSKKPFLNFPPETPTQVELTPPLFMMPTSFRDCIKHLCWVWKSN